MVSDINSEPEERDTIVESRVDSQTDSSNVDIDLQQNESADNNVLNIRKPSFVKKLIPIITVIVVVAIVVNACNAIFGNKGLQGGMTLEEFTDQFNEVFQGKLASYDLDSRHNPEITMSDWYKKEGIWGYDFLSPLGTVNSRLHVILYDNSDKIQTVTLYWISGLETGEGTVTSCAFDSMIEVASPQCSIGDVRSYFDIKDNLTTLNAWFGEDMVTYDSKGYRFVFQSGVLGDGHFGVGIPE